MCALQVAQRAIPAAAVHDTVAAVVHNPAFSRSLQHSVAEVITLWLVDAFGRAARLIRHLPASRTVAIGAISLIVLAVAVRTILAARAGRHRDGAPPHRRGFQFGEDPWQLAEGLAADGRLEEAAHAMYRGALNGMAAAERMKLDPSKTSGDYLRELRRRGSSAFVPFRAFVRRFDVAVYGHGGCDADALRELRELGAPFRDTARAA